MTSQDLDHLGPEEDQVSPEDQECLSGEGGAGFKYGGSFGNNMLARFIGAKMLQLFEHFVFSVHHFKGCYLFVFLILC